MKLAESFALPSVLVIFANLSLLIKSTSVGIKALTICSSRFSFFDNEMATLKVHLLGAHTLIGMVYLILMFASVTSAFLVQESKQKYLAKEISLKGAGDPQIS